MRLISTFKDYYDGLQDPTDQSLVYARIPKTLTWDDVVTNVVNSFRMRALDQFVWIHERRLGQDTADNVAREWHNQIVPEFEDPGGSRSRGEPSYHMYESETVLFCGKLYRGIRYQERWKGIRDISGNNYWSSNRQTISRVYWDMESFLKDHSYRPGREARWSNQQEIARQERIAMNYLTSLFSRIENQTVLDQHFATRSPVISMIFDQEQKASVHSIGEWTAILNPCLKDKQFIRALDPHTAFQELSMFVGGVLSNNDKPEPVDNKYKILAHGFDLKDSFRKAPTKSHV